MTIHISSDQVKQTLTINYDIALPTSTQMTSVTYNDLKLKRRRFSLMLSLCRKCRNVMCGLTNEVPNTTPSNALRLLEFG